MTRIDSGFHHSFDGPGLPQPDVRLAPLRGVSPSGEASPAHSESPGSAAALVDAAS